MPPETPEPEQWGISDLVRENREARSDNSVNDEERERLRAISAQIQSYARRRGDETSEAFQKRQKSLMAAIEKVAADERISVDTIISYVWPYGEKGNWFLANVRENPAMVERIQKGITAIEDTWQRLEQRNLPPKQLAAQTDYKGMRDQLFCVSGDLHQCSDPQLQELMTTHRIFRRLLSLYLSMYGKTKGPLYSREVMRALSTLAERIPTLSTNEAIASNFIERTATLLRGTLSHRALFFAMARNGPRMENRTYMNSTAYRNMAADLHNNTFRIPEGLEYYTNDPLIAGQELMYLYGGGGFEIAEILVELARGNNPQLTEQIRKSRILQHMFHLATHPSPVNGHVSLSVNVLRALVRIAQVNPSLFSDFIDITDTVLGQTPRQFFVANAPKEGATPFDRLTDAKLDESYHNACRMLIAALGVGPNGLNHRTAYEQYGSQVRSRTATVAERQLLFRTIRDSRPIMDQTEWKFYYRFLIAYDPDGPEAAAR